MTNDQNKDRENVKAEKEFVDLADRKLTKDAAENVKGGVSNRIALD